VARLAGIGVFVIGTLLLFAVGLFMIGERQMAFGDKFEIYTEFATITGLQPGAIVRVSGATAGTVREIEPPAGPAGKFKARLRLAEELHQLVRTDSVAAIETEGLVGGSFLAISTGTAGAPEAPPGSTIPSREPFQLAQLMQQMGETVSKVNATIDEMSGGIEHAVTSLGLTVDNANALISDVRDEVKSMASAGARISNDVAEITEGVRRGEGTVGKLVKDDELYQRITRIARSAEDIVGDTRDVIRQARKTFEGIDSKEGPIATVTANLQQTLDDAQSAMAGFADNMEALKRNFLFRGFFNDRGYFNLSDISPADYREGVLAAGGDRRPVRVWLRSGVLFEGDALTEDGRRRLDSAMAPFLGYLPGGVLMVEGYAQGGTQDEQFLIARARAAIVRDYLIGKFHFEPRATGLMPLGARAVDSPDGDAWDGVALALFVEHLRPN
jgi:phospholipid/cholesterol/gamma-HCH transport system substrate-binding protein